jgi:hypothetical protein
MRDAKGTVLYVGKARNLRRLTSHFRSGPATGRRARLLAAAADIEVVLVHNETEALILENNLIKLHQPRDNRLLLDADEGYFYIALTAESRGLLCHECGGLVDVDRHNPKQCCVGDEGRPLGTAAQAEVPNRRKLRRHHGRGGERCGNGAPGERQV